MCIILTGIVLMTQKEGTDDALAWLQKEMKEITEKQKKALTPNLQEEIKLISVIISLLKDIKVDPALFEEAANLVMDVLSNGNLTSNEKLRMSLLNSLQKMIVPLSETKVGEYIHLVLSKHSNKDINADS